MTGERGGVNYSDWAKDNGYEIRFNNKKMLKKHKMIFINLCLKTDTSKTKWVDEITTLSNEFNTKIIKDFDNGNMSKLQHGNLFRVRN